MIQFTEDQVKQIITLISEMPAKHSYDTIRMIHTEIDKQKQPKENVKPTTDKPNK